MLRATEHSRHFIFRFVFQLSETQFQRGDSIADLLRNPCFGFLPRKSGPQSQRPCLGYGKSQWCLFSHLKACWLLKTLRAETSSETVLQGARVVCAAQGPTTSEQAGPSNCGGTPVNTV